MNIDITPELIESLAELAKLTPEPNTSEEVLQRIVDASVETFPGCDSASLTVPVEGKLTTPSSSDDVAVQLDQAQYKAKAGPCVDATLQGATHLIDDTSQEERWPEFRRAAIDHGIRSSLSLPLSGDVVGGLNLYGRRPGSFDEGSVVLGQMFVSHAAVAITNAELHSAARVMVSQIQEALESRDVIGAAKGILMEREAVTSDEAFEMLRSVSQNSNIKLRDVAAALVAKEEKRLSREQDP